MTPPPEARNSFVVTRNTTASRQQVWDVISDGWTYSQWVVGNSRMRAVDPSWPSPGSTIHHSIGVWPALLNDETVAVDCEPLQELVLIAKGRPFGAARITLRLTDCRQWLSHRDVRGAGESSFEMVAPLGCTGRSMAPKSRMHLAAGGGCRTPQAW